MNCGLCGNDHTKETPNPTSAAHALLLRSVDPDIMDAALEHVGESISSDMVPRIQEAAEKIGRRSAQTSADTVISEIGGAVGTAFANAIASEINERLANAAAAEKPAGGAISGGNPATDWLN